MPPFLALLLTFSLLFAPLTTPPQQTQIEIRDLAVSYFYGEGITFTAHLFANVPVQEAYLFFVVQGEQNTHLIPLQPDSDGQMKYRHRIADGIIRPFARVEYWFQVNFTDGQTVVSDHAAFRYTDNRYPWQTLESGLLSVHWYAGDMSFGQEALDAARTGLEKAQVYLGYPPTSKIDLYIYATPTDLQNALQLGGLTWIAGHAAPDLDVALVSIEPGENQSTEMARQIPHELAHILLYRMTGPPYVNLPTWLVEGIASQMEQTINPDYVQVLNLAIEKNNLIPINNLCGPFPADVSGAILAYAESDSFVRYLHDTYGASGLQLLLRAYADGIQCEQGARQALGLPLSQLNSHWQKAVLGQDVLNVALANLFPYLAMLALVLLIPAWRMNPQKQESPAHERYLKQSSD